MGADLDKELDINELDTVTGGDFGTLFLGTMGNGATAGAVVGGILQDMAEKAGKAAAAFAAHHWT